jgi:L-lactate utilization protein LutB
MMNSPLFDQNFESIRNKAYAIRHNYFDDMDKHLLSLENVLMKNGMNVLWAKDRNSLFDNVNSLIDSHSVRRICFDSRLPFENSFHNKVEIVSVDKLEDSSDDVEMLVVDADFAVSENGSMVLLDKKSACCFNKTKRMTVIVNIDQVITSQQDISFFIALKYLAKESKMPHDVKIIKKGLQYVSPSNLSFLSDQPVSQEPMDVSVILYLNGIEDIISSDILKESLYCIQCGRCLEVCPVASAHDGISPIELVKMNSLDKYNQTQHIFSHTTLCGACAEACPVNIPLTKLLLSEMQISNMVVKPSRSKQLYSLFSKRSKLNRANGSFFRFFFVKRFFGKNRLISKYFSNQNSDFFNISYQPPYEDNPNELIKDSDFE